MVGPLTHVIGLNFRDTSCLSFCTLHLVISIVFGVQVVTHRTCNVGVGQSLVVFPLKKQHDT